MHKVYHLILAQIKTNGISLLKVCVTCMTELLKAVPHFNFRLNLITAIVSKMVLKKYPELTAMCGKALTELFENDELGEASMESVQVMADKFKAYKYDIPPQAITPLYYLRLAEFTSGKYRREKKRKSKEGHVSKKQRKIDKHQKEVEEEMREAEAVYEQDLVDKFRSESLKLMFVIYFRLLKMEKNRAYLPFVLEGLSKFARLINMDMFDDVLAVLKKICLDQQQEYIQGHSTHSIISSLHCIISAFELLDSIGGTLKVDLGDFYTSMYSQLNMLYSRPGLTDHVNLCNDEKRNEAQLLIFGIEWMLKKNREVPVERVAAFVKRLLTLSCSTSSNASMAYLIVIQKAFEVILLI